MSEALRHQGNGKHQVAESVLASVVREDPDRWLSPLVLGMLLSRNGKAAEAERMLDQCLERLPTRAILDAAHANEKTASQELHLVQAAIHAYHARGRIQLLDAPSKAPPWISLKNPIGSLKLLANDGRVGMFDEQPTWTELTIAAPGCQPTQGSLRSYDLYNNLLVAYMLKTDYHDTWAEREEEFAREDLSDPLINPLLSILRHLSDRENWKVEREHLVWAVSNAERLLKVGPAPRDARLSFNLLVLLEQVDEFAPDDATREGLERRREQLTIEVANGFERLTSDERHKVAPLLARRQLMAAVEGKDDLRLDDEVVMALPGDQAEVARRLTWSLSHRGRLREMLAKGRLDEELAQSATEASLGSEATAEWSSALRRDLAVSTAARVSVETDPDVQARLIHHARGLLSPEDRVPESVQAASASFSLARRLHWEVRSLAEAERAPVLVGGACFVMMAWLLGRLRTQLLRRRALFASYYRAELDWKRRR
ncbi:MAG: hypothetical protein AAF533_13080 [Acidobacteriota bacterium]